MKTKDIPPCPKCGHKFPTVQYLRAENKLVCTRCGIQGTPQKVIQRENYDTGEVETIPVPTFADLN